jgi:hypothetical protein
MAVFAQNTKGRDAKRSQWGETISLRMALGTTIYKGDIVWVQAAAGVATGLCQSLIGEAGLAAGDMFAGVAAETKTAKAGGVTYINVYTKGIFEFKTDEVAAQTDVGLLIYAGSGADMTPSYCVKATTLNPDLPIGICVDWPSTTLRRVLINNYAMHTHGVGV